MKDLNPAAKILAMVILIVGIVITAPHSLLVGLSLVAVVLLLGFIAEASLTRMLLQSLVVVPIAGMISLFFPLRFVTDWHWAGLVTAYAGHWQEMLQLIATPWLSVLSMMLLVQTTARAQLLLGLERLRLPRILVLMLSFMYRYVDVMRNQLNCARRALESRAPALTRRKQLLLYGNLAGSMLIRAYDRGERIYAAMLSRGYTGTLPCYETAPVRFGDVALVAGSALFVVAMILV